MSIHHHVVFYIRFNHMALLANRTRKFIQNLKKIIREN